MAESKKEFTTLCYLEKDGKYLMLHRTKKENDINKDKYIGVGGHIEHGESPEDCLIREVREETGYKLRSFKLRGLLTFVIDDYDEYSFLYTSDDFEVAEADDAKNDSCDEGKLIWIFKEDVDKLPIWEGDKIFFNLLNVREDYFSLKLVYIKDVLKEAYLDGDKIL